MGPLSIKRRPVARGENFALQRRVRSRLPPPAVSQVRTYLAREFAFLGREATIARWAWNRASSRQFAGSAAT
jgi:hypothetical protein